MNPLDWVKLFADFAKVAPAIVEAFTAKHPELSEAPKADEQRAIRDDFLDDVAAKFPSDDSD